MTTSPHPTGDQYTRAGMDPKEYDREAGIMTAVDKVVEFLREEGRPKPSSSSFHPGIQYSTTGKQLGRCNHRLKNFTPSEERQIFTRLTKRR